MNSHPVRCGKRARHVGGVELGGPCKVQSGKEVLNRCVTDEVQQEGSRRFSIIV